MSVDAVNAATLQFMDEDGKVVFSFPDDRAGGRNK
jgi:hypothetical protein